MAIVSAGSGSATVSVFPFNPVPGEPASVTANFSGSVYNDGDTTETITFSWSFDGCISSSDSADYTLRPNENFSAGTKTANGSISPPCTASASFSISWNGTVLVSGSGSIEVTQG